MSDKLGFRDKIGVLDPQGLNLNPMNGEPYSDQYRALGKVWSSYSAFEKAEEVLQSMDSHQLLFVVSSPGTGKTVMLPKFALHYTGYKGKVIVTLPKRVVTLSAASFAAKTMDVILGKEIGYVYKGSDKKMAGPQNKIVYVTDGTLIAKFVNDPLLLEYKVIIIDEAHERRVSIDLLLLFLRQLLKSGKRPDLRVIIMSATIDPQKYQKYFGGSDGVKSKIINITGQPNHDIIVHYLDHPSKSYMKEGLELIGEIVNLPSKKDLLFFITTSNEALQLCREIRPKYPKVYCIEVYADMDKNLKIYAETRDKYLELGNYDQKLIMATNVAESSLTIDGLKYVIDSGYELYSYFDPETVGQVLEKKLISKAQALQRRGRVGRTEPGICYHLLTKEQFDSLEPYPTPDIFKQDITIDILKVIQLTESKTYDEGIKLLNQLMDPPKKQYINLSRDLFNMYNIIGPDGKLTKAGNEITKFSSLPINRTLFLIYSFQLHCAKEASVIIAMLDALNGKLSNLFYKSDTICESDCRKPSSRNLIQKLVDRKGDHFTFLNIFTNFKEAADQKAWTRKYGIKMDLLNSVDSTSRQYFFKILNSSRAPQLDRVKNIDTQKRLLEALKLSHQHLVAKKMVQTYAKKKIEGQINKESAVHYFYTKKDLANKTFIYDQLTNISNNWEYSSVTLI